VKNYLQIRNLAKRVSVLHHFSKSVEVSDENLVKFFDEFMECESPAAAWTLPDTYGLVIWEVLENLHYGDVIDNVLALAELIDYQLQLEGESP
jgi:hypothetical protein